jgi:pyruvate/2-oxoglutarate dehydrogenase complex dihydrolipoamide dehydrogenase (E3) component
VTIIEQGPQLAGQEDPDVADELRRILTDEGIEVLVAAETRRVQGRSGGEVSLLVRTSSGEQAIAGSDILVATGRTPNTAGLGLDVAGVELDGRGYITVTDRLETTAPGVWAIGEGAGSPQFTHVSFDDFRVIRDNLAGGNRTTLELRVQDPPLASCAGVRFGRESSHSPGVSREVRFRTIGRRAAPDRRSAPTG